MSCGDEISVLKPSMGADLILCFSCTVEGGGSACPRHPAAAGGMGVLLCPGGGSASLGQGHACQEHRQAFQGRLEGRGRGRGQAARAGTTII